MAEEDLVEVDLEDRMLVEVALDPQRQQRFTEFAVERAIVGEKAFGDLLGDRAATLDDRAGANIGEHRPTQTPPVETPVPEKSPVLGRQERREQRGRDLVDRRVRPMLTRQLSQDSAVDCVDPRNPGRFFVVAFNLADVRQFDHVGSQRAIPKERRGDGDRRQCERIIPQEPAKQASSCRVLDPNSDG